MKCAVVSAMTLVLAAGVTAAAAAEDLAVGEKAFRKCAACHDVGRAAQIKVGPPLNDIEGRPAGSYPGYSYSDANRKSGIVWNEVTFKAYIRHPAARVPGTKMLFAGIGNAREIAALWAYLRQFDATGAIKATTIRRAGKP